MLTMGDPSDAPPPHGPYEKVRLIGQGGYGQVYLVREVGTSALVNLLPLNPDPAPPLCLHNHTHSHSSLVHSPPSPALPYLVPSHHHPVIYSYTPFLFAAATALSISLALHLLVACLPDGCLWIEFCLVTMHALTRCPTIDSTRLDGQQGGANPLGR